MRIAFLAPEFWDSASAGGKDLARILSRQHEVVYLEPIATRQGRLARPVVALRDDSDDPASTRFDRRLRDTRLRDMGVIYGLYAEARNAVDVAGTEADLMITYYTLLAVTATVQARLCGRKVLLVYADDLPNLFRPRLAGLTVGLATLLVARMATASVVTAHKLADDLRPYCRNVHYIPNGVDLARFEGQVKPKSNGAFVVGFVGAFGKWANFDLVLDAARRLPDVHFLLVGGRDQYEQVKEQARPLPNVELTGIVPHTHVPALINRMDVCLIPFHINRLTDRVSPLKLFEYWAMRRPVISTRFYEAVQSAHGALTFADNADELVAAIQRLRSDPDLRAELAERGYEAVRQYDWEVLGQRFLNLVESL